MASVLNGTLRAADSGSIVQSSYTATHQQPWKLLELGRKLVEHSFVEAHETRWRTR